MDAAARTSGGGPGGGAGNRDLDHGCIRGGACPGRRPGVPGSGDGGGQAGAAGSGNRLHRAPAPSRRDAKKKGITGTTHRDPKSREEEMRQVRQEVVQKLKFQNSFDTGPKPGLPKAKDHDKAQLHPPVR